ncbi:MAG TPA: antibiotic biosynthesis monooxygenase [Burkholderiaceae bacterium]|jgi:heme-degrading monooxygenase HmoA|nr:antibiotic biosynthesis monooxygenase [Burkholderiaceae bacterium]
MFTATFIFDTKQFDEDFHRLDAIIAAAARETVGYLGEEAWEDPKNGRISNVYYWESEQGLKQLMEHPTHREAKKRYSEWLSGYQVVISQVLRSYGDRAFVHPSAPVASPIADQLPPTLKSNSH